MALTTTTGYTIINVYPNSSKSTYIQFYECNRCGATTRNTAKHNTWHTDLDNLHKVI